MYAEKKIIDYFKRTGKLGQPSWNPPCDKTGSRRLDSRGALPERNEPEAERLLCQDPRGLIGLARAGPCITAASAGGAEYQGALSQKSLGSRLID
jgi:hypothetical protein